MVRCWLAASLLRLPPPLTMGASLDKVSPDDDDYYSPDEDYYKGAIVTAILVVLQVTADCPIVILLAPIHVRQRPYQQSL